MMITAACGGANDTADSGADVDASGTYAAIEVAPPTATLTIPLGTTQAQAYTAYGIATDGSRAEITSGCAFSLDGGYGTFVDATATVGYRGGKAIVTAACGGQSGQAQLIVNLTGAVVQGDAPANSAELFDAATLGTDPARVPAIQYPIDGAISPRNIPSIETQWAVGANNLFHLSMISSYASIHVYTTAREALLTAPEWDSLAGTAAGEQLAFTVEGMVQAEPATKFTSTPVKVVMTHDNIDETAIYYWASSQGNVMSQVFGSPEAPTVVKGNCTSCHSVSRSGDRVGYSRCVGGCGAAQTGVGFLKYNAITSEWDETVNADDLAILGSFTTFTPDGNLAMVTMNNGTFRLYNPDNGAPIASNLAVANLGDTKGALMPDWSYDGSRVAYVAANAGNWIDLDNGTIHTMSYSLTNGEHVFGAPTPLIPNPLVLPNGNYTNFFFPSFSPDGALVVANAARGNWRRFGNDPSNNAASPGQRLVLSESQGAWTVDLNAMNGGAVDANITWAHWAPTVSEEYYWIVFSSERDYGHRTTVATSPDSCRVNGVQQCKQIWLGAVARSKLTGLVDPSAPPMWMPGQDSLANNISPYWSRPAVLQ